MQWAFGWFFGQNDVRAVLYDFTTGGCFDGLHPAGVNRNQGGESTVCWLLALHQMHLQVHQAVRGPEEPLETIMAAEAGGHETAAPVSPCGKGLAC